MGINYSDYMIKKILFNNKIAQVLNMDILVSNQ